MQDRGTVRLCEKSIILVLTFAKWEINLITCYIFHILISKLP